MINKKTFIVIPLLFAGIYSYAQSPVYYTGYGRALISNSKFDESSEFIKDDTSSTKKALDGNFVFDLGINIKPSDQFKASTILRISNEFGGFYSTGSALEFRQVQVQGVLAKKVLYNIGDIDLGLTKYTLHNFYESSYSEFEADAFKIKRSIVDYDNFNFGNKWRLQGVQASTSATFEKLIEQIDFSAFGTRIRPSDFMATPDRLIFGGSVKVRQSRFFEVGGNIVSLSDIAGTVQDTVVFYKNTVVTGTYKASASTRTLNFSAFGELGRSFYDLNMSGDSLRVKTTDGFFDVGVSAGHRYIPFTIAASYRLVGPDFSSPGAQTRRILDNETPRLLNEGLSGAGIRSQTVFDRLSDLNLYNRSISSTLMYFNPMYNNATPYGQATPNRKGLTVDIDYGHKDSLLYANVNTQLLSEVLGTGIKDKRSFMVINGGATLNINKLLKSEKLFALSTGVRYENTSGSKAANVDLTSMLLDAGLTIETLKKLDVMGGIKYFTANGTENTFIRNDFNEIVNYTLFEADGTQAVYTGGIRYRFTNYIFFAANAFFLKNDDNKTSTNSYQLKQYFFSYIMKF